MKFLLKNRLYFVLFFLTPFAHSATIFQDDFSPQQPGWSFSSPSIGFMGELNNNVNVNTVSLTIANPTYDPNAVLTFDLLAIRSLDASAGQYNDTFNLAINGSTIFSADFGHNNEFNIHQNNNAATVLFNTDHFEITIPHTILVGTNVYDFSYTPLQSLADEAWGLDNVVIESSIPNPETALLLGLGLIGLAGIRINGKS